MTTLRTAAQQALEALEYENSWHEFFKVRPYASTVDAITALRAALAQQAEPDAYGYASRLAVAIWEKHYKDTAPDWKPLDDLMGVLTQIDNMTSGLTRLAQQAEPVEPVAWYQKRGQEVLTSHPACWGREDEPWTPLYTAPPQRKPLTEEEILKAIGWERAEMYMKLAPNFPVDEAKQETLKNARAVERAVWEKNHG